MPEKTSPKTKSKGKGKGLTKKVGPLPVYAYLIGVGIVLLYLYYRHRNSSGQSTAGSQNQQLIPSGIVVPQSGGGSGTTTGNDNQGSGDSSINFPTDYATQTDLQNAIDSIDSSTASSIAAITFPQRTNNFTPPQTTVSSTTTKSKTAAKKHALGKTSTKYYTKKTQVHLKAGQTLHFHKGKGYYAG